MRGMASISEVGVACEVLEFLGPLDELRQKARMRPALIQEESWRIEMMAAIAAARACGVSSDTLSDYEGLL